VFAYEKEYLYAWLLDVAFELGAYPVTETQLGSHYGVKYRCVTYDCNVVNTLSPD
jgi:hypothetical protein